LANKQGNSLQPLALPRSILSWNPTSLHVKPIFHSTVASLCLAAMGLKWYINNKDSPEGFVMTGYPSVVFEFVLYRKQMKELDEQYKAFSDWIEAHGGCPHGRWGS
jgi:hypothetical protein